MNDNTRIVNSEGTVDCSWTIVPGADHGSDAVTKAFALLADYQSAEPDSGWHLETRGEIAPWHDWQR